MSRQDALEWCDRNMHSNYPLTDASTAISVNGAVLPSSFLVDFQLILENKDEALGQGIEDRFFLSAVYESLGSLYVEVSFQSDEGPVLCCRSDAISLGLGNTDDISSRTVRLHPVRQENTDYRNLASARGFFIVGSCIDMQSVAELTFTYEAGALISTRVYDIAVDSDPNEDEFDITEYLTIKPGLGISFDVEESWYNDVKYTTLTINRTTPADIPYLNTQELAEHLNTLLPTVISSINGVLPDDSGNIVIEGADCVDVSGTGNGLMLRNSCAKPCCDERDREVYEDELAAVEEAQTRIETAIEKLSANLLEMNGVIKGLMEQEGGEYNVDPLPDGSGDDGDDGGGSIEPVPTPPTPEPGPVTTAYSGIIVQGMPLQELIPSNYANKGCRPSVVCLVHRDSAGNITTKGLSNSAVRPIYSELPSIFQYYGMESVLGASVFGGYSPCEHWIYIPYKTVNISDTPANFNPDLRQAFAANMSNLRIAGYMAGCFGKTSSSELLYIMDGRLVTFLLRPVDRYNQNALFAFGVKDGFGHDVGLGGPKLPRSSVYKLSNGYLYTGSDIWLMSDWIPTGYITRASDLAYTAGFFDGSDWSNSLNLDSSFDPMAGFSYPPGLIS